MNVLEKKKHIFFTGIGGIGMSGIAEILLDSGYEVSGSDRQLSEITVYLSEKGAHIYEGHRADNLQDVELLVYSSAIPENNPERRSASQMGIPQIRRAEMLAQIMQNKYNIAIAGTHGKTTTTALCAEVVINGRLDPTVVIGGRLKNLKTNARLGRSDLFITEADEFDRSFLALSPTISVITTVEEDHLDCYADFADIKKSFVQFANNVPENGFIICCEDDQGIQQIRDRFIRSVITYGFSPDADYKAVDYHFDKSYSVFEIEKDNKKIGSFSLMMPGKHNILNAMAAIVVGQLLKIPIENIKETLSRFSGVDRRFEIKGIINDIIVVDDYAHHPTEVAATIDSAKTGWEVTLTVVFQPHLFSRTRDFYKQFSAALSRADEIILADIYPAREEPIPGVTSRMIYDEAREQGQTHFKYIPEKSRIEEYLLDHLKPGSMVITMGAGDIWTLSDKLVTKLKK